MDRRPGHVIRGRREEGVLDLRDGPGMPRAVQVNCSLARDGGDKLVCSRGGGGSGDHRSENHDPGRVTHHVFNPVIVMLSIK